MDYHDIFMCCRMGDLDRVRYLVESRDVELNIRDKWDTTPLYYACLCGHEAVVEYLLENGAKCEANTFDGERCLYAALNDGIKKMLKAYKMITSSVMRRDLYDEFLRRLLEDECYCDVSFLVNGKKITAHQSVLLARCPFLHQRLLKKAQGKDVVSINHPKIDALTFKLLLRYIYTGKVQVTSEKMYALKLLAEKCGMSNLLEQIESVEREKASFEMSKLGVNVGILCIESDGEREQLVSDLHVLVEQSLPVRYSSICEELPFAPQRLMTHPDVCYIVEGYEFLCHLAFFCCRSDYFKALAADHFGESTTPELITLHLHDISAEIFICVLTYIYTDTCKITDDSVYDVLYKADLYLLPGLKRLCSNYISKNLEVENVVSIMRSSRLFNLPKLEDQCAEFIALNIEKVIERLDFAELIMEDVLSIKHREESDSIDIIDSVRYHLTSHVQTYSAIAEANEKLKLVDQLLERLSLDC